MRLFQLVERWLNGEVLSPAEKMQVVEHIKRLEDAVPIAERLVTPGTSSLTLRNAYLVRPYLDGPSWGGSALHLCATVKDTPTTIANNTQTYLTPTSVTNLGADSFVVTGDQVDWVSLKGKAFMVGGWFSWTANATGYRVAWLEGFDSDDVSIGETPLHTFPGFTGVDNVMPVCLPFYFNDFDYLKIKVLQTSGGDLDLKDFVLSFMLA